MSNRSLNLIPPSTRRRRLVQRALRLWFQSTLASGLVVGLLLGAEWLRGVAVLRELDRLQGQCSPLEKLRQETATTEQNVNRLAAREALTERLARDDRGIAVLAALTMAASSGQGDVYVKSIIYRGGDSPELKIEGTGLDSAAVAGFVERLERTGVFLAVQIDSNTSFGGEAVNLRRFDLVCQI